MIRLPLPPAEPPAQTDLAAVAPALRVGVLAVFESMRNLGHDPVVLEALRSTERQSWLFGFGRDYDDDDPRGIVTNASTGDYSWHTYGCAVDVTSLSMGDRAPGLFWYHLGKCVRSQGLVWGGDWPRFTDRPHVQCGPPMRQSPSSRAAELFASGGFPAVWAAVGAL